METNETKRYRGHRDGTMSYDRLHVDVVTGGRAAPLRHIVRHSPDGMNCGYWGSGPCDLALSILVDYLGEGAEALLGAEYPERTMWLRWDKGWTRETLADYLYQAFKRDVIGDLPVERDWEITGDQIETWIMSMQDRGDGRGREVGNAE